MDMDGNLLLSVLGGLGRVDVSNDGLETYVKDDDCVGRRLGHSYTCRHLYSAIACASSCMQLILSVHPAQSASKTCSAFYDTMMTLQGTPSSFWGKLRPRGRISYLSSSDMLRTSTLFTMLVSPSPPISIALPLCSIQCMRWLTCLSNDVCVKYAVKVVTFMTMPAEPESRDFPAQVRAYEYHES